MSTQQPTKPPSSASDQIREHIATSRRLLAMIEVSPETVLAAQLQTSIAHSLIAIAMSLERSTAQPKMVVLSKLEPKPSNNKGYSPRGRSRGGV